MNSGIASLCRIGLVVYQYFLIGLLWFMTIVLGFGLTIGAATTAAYVTVSKLKADETDQIFVPYFKALFQNFIVATAMWFLLLFIYRVAMFNLLNAHLFGSLQLVAMVVHVFIIFELLLAGLYIFPMIGKYKNNFFMYIKTAFKLMHGHFIKTLTLVIMLIVVSFCIFKIEYS
ncbi:MAG: DUF624 domain-containing protein, partial [Turicibacter sp.]